jgi:hypothetical protein
LDLQSSSEVVMAGLGLVLTAEARPVQCVLDGLRRLANDVEKSSDLGECERDHSPATGRRRWSIR